MTEEQKHRAIQLTHPKEPSFRDEFDKYFNDMKDMRGFLNVAIEWIAKNLSPDEVFPKRELLTFLEDEHKAGRLENKLPQTQNY